MRPKAAASSAVPRHISQQNFGRAMDSKHSSKKHSQLQQAESRSNDQFAGFTVGVLMCSIKWNKHK